MRTIPNNVHTKQSKANRRKDLLGFQTKENCYNEQMLTCLFRRKFMPKAKSPMGHLPRVSE